MKTNKEFIDGIYKKADEISAEKKIQKNTNIKTILSIAAVFIMVFTIGIINTEHTRDINKVQDSAQIKESKISLQTVGSFENLCNILKNNESKIVYYPETMEEEVFDSTTQTLNAQANSREEAINESKTNTQVENVDEADIVKVDNNYIYYKVDKKIVIIDATNPKETKKISEINFEEDIYPEELYVNKNKLIVIARNRDSSIICDVANYYDLINPISSQTSVIIYDISDKIQPKQIRRVEIEGDYLSSRMIQNNIYFATTKYIYASEIVKEETDNLDETKYQPKYKDTIINENYNCIDYNCIYCFEEIETTSYLMLAGINLDSNEEVKIQTFLGAGSNVYASEKNMYIGKTNIKYGENHDIVDTNTHLLKFSLNNGNIEFSAETDIDGEINNQFSMDENGEYFRIATTTGVSISGVTEQTSNSLYILNDKLEEVGKVTGFGMGEKIYSVRYVGDKAYVVTFKQTDPLFVIDLSNPSQPSILGELKIPGYSTYMHPYDETHIIGFGYDTKEDGTRITTNGLKMVMFDVSDVNNPKELFKVEVGDRNTSSELTYNHKALLYLKEKNIIAFPLTTYTRNKVNTRAAIYEISLEEGFKLKREISNEEYESGQRVERIVFVNNTYYTLSRKLIKCADIDTLEIIKQIEI